MLSRLSLRRTVVQLALSLVLLASLQAALYPAAAYGVNRFVDLSAGRSGGDATRHDHATVICHSCPGHICLEQHNLMIKASVPPAILPGALQVMIVTWPTHESVAHPPIAPPPPFVASAARPRAPPLSPPKSSWLAAALA